MLRRPVVSMRCPADARKQQVVGLGQRAAVCLSEVTHLLRRGANEGNARCLAIFRECCVFRQEPVTGGWPVRHIHARFL